MISLETLLTLSFVNDACFTSRHHQCNLNGSLFGGQLLGQAGIAASHTLADRKEAFQLNSLKGYFLIPGNANTPVNYQVSLLSEGRSFITCRVDAIQDGEKIFSGMLSFHTSEEGFLSFSEDLKEVPAPDQDWPHDVKFAELFKSVKDVPYLDIFKHFFEGGLFSFAPSREAPGVFYQDGRAGMELWVRSRNPIPQLSYLHAAGFAVASDLGIILPSIVSRRLALIPSLKIVSLNHSFWLHSQVDFNNWCLIRANCYWAGSARVIARAGIYALNGCLIASIMQEGLVRLTCDASNRG